MLEWPKQPQTGQNLTQGETGGITILDYMPIRDISTISNRTV